MPARLRAPTTLLYALVLALALCPWALTPAGARDVDGRAGPTPAKNFSNIHSDVDWVRKVFESAANAREDGDHGASVRLLQEIIDQTRSRESEEDAAPYVQAVHGSAVYEGAWIVARHRLASWGSKSMAAYEREFGTLAERLFAQGRRRQDLDGLASLARRFLGLPPGRRAALLLIDLALARGDRDEALGWIEALEDLEAVSTESEASLERWRAARVRRQALALARNDADVAPIVQALMKADPRSGSGIDAVPAAHRRREAAPTTWPTTAGNAARNALPASLGSSFTLQWFKPPSDDDDLTDSRDPAPAADDRPSIWLPPRAVATDEHLFVSDGQYLHVYRLSDGERVVERRASQFPYTRSGGHGTDSREDRRGRYGLLEGHTLSVHPVTDFEGLGRRGWIKRRGAGWLVLAAVPDGNPWYIGQAVRDVERRRNDHIQAYHWDGMGRLTRLWRVGGLLMRSERQRLVKMGLKGLRPDTRLYGAPLFYRGRIWVAGVRPSRATNDRWESWVFGLNPQTGSVEVKTHLGTGTPMRTGRMDEVVPTSPAAAHGRVVVSTALGFLGAVDARDGRVQWIFRYDRWVETERGRLRNRERTDEGPRPSSFSNEPPVLALDRCFATPTDSNKIVVVFNRPRTARRSMMSHGLTKPDGSSRGELISEFQSRDEVSSEFMAEQVAGVIPGDGEHPDSLILVGQGESGPSPGPIVVSLLARDGALGWPMGKERELLWREENVTGFGAEPYGRALVTAGEVFVPTAQGIVMYEVFDRDGDQSHYLGILNRKAMPGRGKDAPPRPYGNLIAIPGRGIVSVSATTIAFWARK